MRSVDAPRVAHDATVEIEAGGRARAVNLSTGGIYVAAEQPLDPGAQVHLKVNLRDGASPVDVEGEVVWRAGGGMALRFVGLDDVARGRIQRVVQKREATQFGRRDVRIHLPALNAPLRATARDLTERGVMLEAELPWLRLGSPVTTELSADRACDGRVQWIGLDVTRAGSARLRIFVDLAEAVAEGLEPASEPPPSEAFLPARDTATPSAWRSWIWPAVALAGLLSTATLAGVLLRRAPAPILLPTAPPERDARAPRLPTSLAVPPTSPLKTSPLKMAPPVAQPAAATLPPAPSQPPALAPTAPSSSPPRPHGKTTHKKRTHVTRRAG